MGKKVCLNRHFPKEDINDQHVFEGEARKGESAKTAFESAIMKHNTVYDN